LTVGGTLTLAGGVNLNGNVTVGDSSADTLTINSTITSNLIFTDNTYDIGASGATRPRSLFLAGNATIGGAQTLTGALTVDSTTDSSSTTTGSIQTDGGIGLAKSLYAGGTVTASQLTTIADANGTNTFGRYSAGYAWSLFRPSATSTGFEFRTNAGDALYQIDQSSGANKHIWYTTTSGEIMRLTSTGLGIGTSTINERLTINGSSNATSRVRLYNQATELGALGSQLGYLGSGGANDLLMYGVANTTVGSNGFVAFMAGGSTERMRITSAGLVGVGMTNPQTRLETLDTFAVRGAFNSGTAAIYLSHGQDPANPASSFVSYKEAILAPATGLYGRSTGIYFALNSANDDTNATISDAKLSILEGGDVGIGTSTPATNLEVTASAPEVRISSSNGGQTSGSSVGKLSFYTPDATTPGGAGVAASIETTSTTSNGSDYQLILSKREGSGGGSNFINLGTSSTGAISFGTNTSGSATERMRITSAGNVGIGTSSPTRAIEAHGSTPAYFGADATGGTLFGYTAALPSNSVSCFVGWMTDSIGPNGTNGDLGLCSRTSTGTSIRFFTGSTTATERVRINASGNVGIGTDQPADTSSFGRALDIQSAGGGAVYLRASGTNPATEYFAVGYSPTAAYLYNRANSPMYFYTNGAERMRISADGNLFIGRTSDTDGAGLTLEGSGLIRTNRDGGTPMVVNRNTDDGTLVSLRQAGAEEGSISVSGTTVSYNGGHLSRWSQLPDGSKDESIVKGTVMSNLDDMCVWEKDGVVAENEQLNKMKVSDVEGDTSVAGVFVNWTMDEQYDVDDMNVAMTGDMIIRIANGVVVQKGDLLMSAGNGTAKPQGDDIIRSKTVAKVTSNYITCTYADGSYCVPCVLMAC
jgi:hypothetical protein